MGEKFFMKNISRAFLVSVSLILSQYLHSNDFSSYNHDFRLTYTKSLRLSPESSQIPKINRVLEGLSCPDTDWIPKVENAGSYTTINDCTYQVMHNGLLIEKGGYYENEEGYTWMSLIIEGLQGHHEPQEESVFYQILQEVEPNGIMVELGGYWSYYSMWFNKTTHGTNYIIEPSSERLLVGKRNFAANDLTAHFTEGYVGTLLDRSVPRQSQKIDLLNYFSENNLNHIHILHSDIQGAEYEMLIEISPYLKAQKIDFLFISTHKSDSFHQSCIKLIEDMGYEVLVEHSRSQSYSCDGLIVAKSKIAKCRVKPAITKKNNSR